MSETSEQSVPPPRQPADPLDTPVASIASEGVVGCPAGATLLDAAGALSAHRVHALVVDPEAGETTVPFAVFSDQDLLDAVALGRDPAAEQVGAVAGTEPVTITADATVREAATRMREHEVSHLFVVDPESGLPRGVVSSLDVARVLVQAAPPAQRPVSVLLGHDGGAGGDDAATLANLLAGPEGAVDALLAIPYPPRRVGDPPIEADPGPGDWEQISAELRAKGEQVLAERALAPLATARRSAAAVIDNSPSAALSDAAERRRPDFIVVGSSRYGRLGRVLIGSTGERLAHGSASPVAIAPRGYAGDCPARICTVAVGFDGGKEAGHALEVAAAVARRHGASLRVIGVLETTVSEGEIIAEAYDALAGKPITDRRKRELTGRIDEAVARHAPDLEVSVEIERGRVADRLVESSRENADLLVVGSRGYGPLARVLLGSTSTRLTREAPCPLLVATRRSY